METINFFDASILYVIYFLIVFDLLFVILTIIFVRKINQYKSFVIEVVQSLRRYVKLNDELMKIIVTDFSIIEDILKENDNKKKEEKKATKQKTKSKG